MQTFLPYESFVLSAQVLDNLRLNKQITEVKQILQALTGETKAWRNHPAVRMWEGCEGDLASFGIFCYHEWTNRFVKKLRGGKLTHKAGDWILEFVDGLDKLYTPPPWLGDERIHSAYRAVLLAKEPVWYNQFGWTEESAVKTNGKWPYVWPV